LTLATSRLASTLQNLLTNWVKVKAWDLRRLPSKGSYYKFVQGIIKMSEQLVAIIALPLAGFWAAIGTLLRSAEIANSIRDKIFFDKLECSSHLISYKIKRSMIIDWCLVIFTSILSSLLFSAILYYAGVEMSTFYEDSIGKYAGFALKASGIFILLCGVSFIICGIFDFLALFSILKEKTQE
jgi:hypothetical protein